eukprot:4909811-Prymnesium_polylepis.2
MADACSPSRNTTRRALGRRRRARGCADGAKVHPRGPRQWHSTPNCTATCEYVCPCGKNCLHHVGGAVEMYRHWQGIRRLAKEKGKGGLRDALREILERHFDRPYAHVPANVPRT